jgi:hypothetical protein
MKNKELLPESIVFGEKVALLLKTKISKGLQDGKIKNNLEEIQYFYDLLLGTMEELQQLIIDYHNGKFDKIGQ